MTVDARALARGSVTGARLARCAARCRSSPKVARALRGPGVWRLRARANGGWAHRCDGVGRAGPQGAEGGLRCVVMEAMEAHLGRVVVQENHENFINMCRQPETSTLWGSVCVERGNAEHAGRADVVQSLIGPRASGAASWIGQMMLAYILRAAGHPCHCEGCDAAKCGLARPDWPVRPRCQCVGTPPGSTLTGTRQCGARWSCWSC